MEIFAITDVALLLSFYFLQILEIALNLKNNNKVLSIQMEEPCEQLKRILARRRIQRFI